MLICRWPGAFDIAATSMGGTWLKNGQIGGAAAHEGLSLLTGYAGTDETIVDRETTRELSSFQTNGSF